MLKFFAEKMWVAFAVHIFSAKNIRILCIGSAKTVNEMTLNDVVKLTSFEQQGPDLNLHCIPIIRWITLCEPYVNLIVHIKIKML